jgi:ABC-type antimicrobial peptide transport system permease subunit
MGWTDKERAVRGEHHYLVIARLKANTQIPQAQAQMNAISTRLAQQYPEDDKGWGAVVIPLREQLVSDVRPALLILLGAVAFVLLIACANVANLVLAKTFGRRKEIAIRVALGATGSRVVQQILAETLLMSLAGGALGLLLARFGIALTLKFLSDNLPKSTEVSLDAFVLVFTVFISIVTGVIAGLLPAIRMTKTNVNDALKQGLGKTDSDSGGRRTRSILVISEVALSLI